MPKAEIGYLLNVIPPDALVIRCYDPRFQKAFDAFQEQELHLKNPLILSLGGSIFFLGNRGSNFESFQTIRQQVRFALEEGRTQRVIIFNHEGCKWYQKFQETGYQRLNEKLVQDLERAAEYVSDQHDGVEIETYFAEIKGGQTFFKVTARGEAIAKKKQSQPHALFYFQKRKREAAHHQLRQAKI